MSHHEQFLSVDFDFCSGVFSIEDVVTGFDDHSLVFCSASNGFYDTFEWFFFRAVGDDDSANDLFGFSRLDQHAVG